jgi:asparagine synthase (glutamine-hydrolysing)
MCGFAGFTGPNDPALLTRMGERIAQRGPDQYGRYEQDGISLVHARLSIIDLSEAGRQPMQTADGRYTIVYNGELYNFKSLREEYTQEGFVFRTQTDTEVFLASLALHGLQDLERIHNRLQWRALQL